MSRPTIAVLFGGQSSEHEISLQSAAAVIRQISPDKYHVICLGITRQGHWLLFEGTPEEIEDGSYSDWKRLRNLAEEKILNCGKRRQICGDCAWDEICRKNEDGTIHENTLQDSRE